MRHLIFAAALLSTVASLNFWEKAQGYLSGGASAEGSASVSTSGSNWLSGLQNSSFGQAVSGGINLYNQAKNGSNSWQSSIANSSVGNIYQQGVDFFNGVKNGNSSFIDTAVIQQTIGNSSFGEVVQSGMDFFNNLKNGNSPFQGDESSVFMNFVPFLANASSEAKTEFYTKILATVGNSTIAEFEVSVNAWAAKYGLTEEVEAFNTRAANMTVQAEEHANAIVMNLPNVLNNLKSITGNKNQTVAEMHQSIISYVNSLDEDTADIVFIFFRSMLPPNFKKPKCQETGNFMANMFNNAMDFFGGGEDGDEKSNKTGGFPQGFGSFFSQLTGNGNGKGNQTHPIMGIFQGFLNKNNISNSDASNIMMGAQNDGFASIQVLPFAPVDKTAHVEIAGNAKIALAPEEEAVTKKTKKQQQQANKNKNKKKKTTTVAPVAADANPEVHTQIL